MKTIISLALRNIFNLKGKQAPADEEGEEEE